MFLFQKCLLSNVFRSPDDPVAAAPGVDPAAPPAAVVADPPVVIDPPEEPESAPQTQAEPKPPTWALKRIGEETRKRQTAEQELSEERRLRREAETLAASLQNRGGDPGAPPAPSAPRAPAPGQQDYQADVRAEAARLRLVDDSTAVRSAGLKQFGQEFNQTLSTLTALGVTTDAVVSDLLAVDKAGAHELLHALAKDPERAIAIAEMDPRTRIAELTRMTMPSKTNGAAAPAADPAAAPAPAGGAKPAAAAAPAPRISQAPRPAPALEPSASNVVDWRDDKASDSDFSRGWDEEQKSRRVRR